jgi:hypothetical protein
MHIKPVIPGVTFSVKITAANYNANEKKNLNAPVSDGVEDTKYDGKMTSTE